MKKGVSGKKKQKVNVGHLDRDAFSALFDEVWAEVALETGRLSPSTMPSPADESRKSWRERASDPLCPVLLSLRELGKGASDSKAFIEALYKHDLAERRATRGGDDPENALDGRSVLALLLGYHLSLYSDHIGRLFETYPQAGSVDHTGLWHSVEVMSVPEGETMPPLQRSIDLLVQSDDVRACRKGDGPITPEAAEAIGGFCCDFYTEIRANDAVCVKKNVLDLVYYLDGLSASIHESLAEVVEAAPLPPPEPKVEPVLNLMDMEPPPAVVVVVKTEPPPSPPSEEEEDIQVVVREIEAPSWAASQDHKAVFDDEDAFGARLRMAVEATNDRRKWRT